MGPPWVGKRGAFSFVPSKIKWLCGTCEILHSHPSPSAPAHIGTVGLSGQRAIDALFVSALEDCGSAGFSFDPSVASILPWARMPDMYTLTLSNHQARVLLSALSLARQVAALPPGEPLYSPYHEGIGATVAKDELTRIQAEVARQLKEQDKQ